MSPLRRGRIITTAGVLLLCFDTPTFRLLQFRVSKDSPQFGLADTPWRGAAYAATSLAFVLRECGGSFAAVVASLRAIGWRLGVAGALLLAGSGTAFPVAVALTTAANVLIILAMSPLITALMGRAMGHKLPLHTWGACVVGAVSVGLVFAGSAKAGPDQTRGCLLALTATFCFSSVMVLGSHLGAVSLIPVFPVRCSGRSRRSVVPALFLFHLALRHFLTRFCGAQVAGVLMVAISLAALGRNATLATPTNGADAGLLILNGLINGIANVRIHSWLEHSIPTSDARCDGSFPGANDNRIPNVSRCGGGPHRIARDSFIACPRLPCYAVDGDAGDAR